MERQSAPSLVRSAYLNVVPCGVNGRSAARARRILPGRHGRRPAINHNAGDYTQSSRASSAPGPPSSCGPSSYNLHYGVRPACGAGCGRRPWRRQPHHRLQQTALREVGLTASAERALCPPGCVWLRRLAVVPPCSFPPRQLPLPAPGWRGHAKPSSSLSLSTTERRRASLAGLASPRPADPSSATASCGLLSVR